MFALDVSFPYKHMCHLADILFPPNAFGIEGSYITEFKHRNERAR